MPYDPNNYNIAPLLGSLASFMEKRNKEDVEKIKKQVVGQALKDYFTATAKMKGSEPGAMQALSTLTAKTMNQKYMVGNEDVTSDVMQLISQARAFETARFKDEYSQAEYLKDEDVRTTQRNIATKELALREKKVQADTNLLDETQYKYDFVTPDLLHPKQSPEVVVTSYNKNLKGASHTYTIDREGKMVHKEEGDSDKEEFDIKKLDSPGITTEVNKRLENFYKEQQNQTQRDLDIAGRTLDIKMKKIQISNHDEMKKGGNAADNAIRSDALLAMARKFENAEYPSLVDAGEVLWRATRSVKDDDNYKVLLTNAGMEESYTPTSDSDFANLARGNRHILRDMASSYWPEHPIADRTTYNFYDVQSDSEYKTIANLVAPAAKKLGTETAGFTTSRAKAIAAFNLNVKYDDVSEDIIEKAYGLWKNDRSSKFEKEGSWGVELEDFLNFESPEIKTNYIMKAYQYHKPQRTSSKNSDEQTEKTTSPKPAIRPK